MSRNGTAFAVLHFEKVRGLISSPSRSRPLGRYFPELVTALQHLKPKMFVLDGEIAVPKEEEFSFDALLQRIHPAASRVQRLALETPSIYVVFDLLAAKDGHSLLTRPLNKRRKLLEAFAREYFDNSTIRLSPATTALIQAKTWLAETGASLDAIISKRCDLG